MDKACKFGEVRGRVGEVRGRVGELGEGELHGWGPDWELPQDVRGVLSFAFVLIELAFTSLFAISLEFMVKTGGSELKSLIYPILLPDFSMAKADLLLILFKADTRDELSIWIWLNLPLSRWGWIFLSGISLVETFLTVFDLGLPGFSFSSGSSLFPISPLISVVPHIVKEGIIESLPLLLFFSLSTIAESEFLRPREAEKVNLFLLSPLALRGVVGVDELGLSLWSGVVEDELQLILSGVIVDEPEVILSAGVMLPWLWRACPPSDELLVFSVGDEEEVELLTADLEEREVFGTPDKVFVVVLLRCV